MLKGIVGRYFDVENLRRARISADIGGFGGWRYWGTCRLSGQDAWAMQRAQGLQEDTCIEELTRLLSDTGINQPLKNSEDSLRLQVANISRQRTEHLVRHAKTDRPNWAGSRSAMLKSPPPPFKMKLPIVRWLSRGNGRVRLSLIVRAPRLCLRCTLI